MAVTSTANFTIYHDQVRAAYAETLAKKINSLIAGANGAIVIQDDTIPGSYLKESFWKFPSGLTSRRITSGTGYTTAVTPTTVEIGENVHVRLSRKSCVELTFDAMRQMGITQDNVSIIIGGMIAESHAEKMLEDAVTAAVAALARSPYIYDMSTLTNSTITRTGLAKGMRLLGDHSDTVVAWLMHSSPYFDLVESDVDTSASVDTLVANVALFGGVPGTLGKPAFVSDLTSLVLDETVDKYYTLGLTAGAIQLRMDGQLSDVVADIVTGKENLTYRIQQERDWFLRLKGFTWDVTNGGANPDESALGTATNWDASSTSAKHRAGICIKTT